MITRLLNVSSTEVRRPAHVTVIRAAISYAGFGANQVNPSLYSDAAGVPGAIPAGPHTLKNLPNDGDCCELATWSLSTSMAVSAGTQYWIVADTPTSGLARSLGNTFGRSDQDGRWSCHSQLSKIGSNGLRDW